MKFTYLLVLGMLVQLITGCTSTPNLRADRSLQSENPMKRISIIGSSSVYWPRMGNNSSILGFKSSKAGLENVLPLIKNALEGKGYQVVFAEPAVIGFPIDGQENIVYPDYDETGSDAQWSLEDDNPAYVYPIFEENEELKSAALDILRDLDAAIKQQKLNRYTPHASSIQVLSELTKGDTVCAVHASGVRYSKARAVGSFFTSVLTGVLTGGMAATSTNTSDQGTATLVCISSKSAKVLWQKNYPLTDDPMDIDQDRVDSGPTYFPSYATNLTSDCEIHQDQKDMFVCD